MTIQLVDLKKQYESIKVEIDSVIAEVLAKTAFIGGSYVRDFEEAFASFCGARHCIGVGNGTDAIFIALKCMGIGEGDEVIVPANSFIATAEAVTQTGARVVFADINPQTYNTDVAGIARRISPQTKAIIPVHLYGQPAEMDPIMAVAREHGLKVIEDSAQALGATYHGTKVCAIGDVGCISFFPSKNLGAFGDGGMLVTHDAQLAERMRMVAAHGSRVRYYHEILGVNSRLDTLQAAILLVKARHLDAWNAERRRAAGRYTAMLAGTPVTPPFIAPGREHIFHQYTVRAPRRDDLAARLKERGIPHAIYYPVPLHLQQAFAMAGKKQGDFPVTEQATLEVLSLPMHTELNEEQQVFVCDTIREFYAGR